MPVLYSHLEKDSTWQDSAVLAVFIPVTCEELEISCKKQSDV